jgi:hypothetical protein
MLWRKLAVATILIGLLLGGGLVDVARACPMCSIANETNESDDLALVRPRAYMYSILFMLTVPATLFAGFSIGFYRLSKQSRGQVDGE